MQKEILYPSKERLHEADASFGEKHPFIPPLNIYTLLRIICKKYYKEQAVDCLDVTITFKELFECVIDVARALSEFGIKRGDIIAISMPNYYQAVVVFLASNMLGAVVSDGTLWEVHTAL